VEYQLALQTSGPYHQLLDNARWAEQHGLSALAVPDHYLLSLDPAKDVPAYDALAQLAALARDTTTIELSILVSPVTFRHPAVLAKTALTIHDLSDGRFTLGIGTGWLEREHALFGFPFPDTAVRFDMLEEALGYVRAMWDDKSPGFAGVHFTLERAQTLPQARGLRLVVGGVGPSKTPRLAGRFADEYNCYPAPLEQFKLRIERARSAAIAASRDPAHLLISSSGAVVAAPTRNGYTEVLAGQAADAGMSVEELEAHMDKRATPRGTYEDVAAQLAAMAEAGMRRFYLQRSGDFDRTADLGLINVLREA
jgi:alkanesulfonate monooxygenase SsuD/methylene tetrahydromethanopterin reductase-like flavin-dependent oxidoreductase (luciferase family)